MKFVKVITDIDKRLVADGHPSLGISIGDIYQVVGESYCSQNKAKYLSVILPGGCGTLLDEGKIKINNVAILLASFFEVIT